MSQVSALTGIVLGAVLAVLGGYLASRAADRRSRRAWVVAELSSDMEIYLSLLPQDRVGELWGLADRARASAMASSRHDARLAYDMLDALDELRSLVRTTGRGTSLAVGSDRAVAQVRSAFDAYLDHLARRLRVPRRPTRY